MAPDSETKTPPESMPKDPDNRFLQAAVDRGLISSGHADEVAKRCLGDKGDRPASQMLIDDGVLTKHIVNNLEAGLITGEEPTAVGGYTIIGKLGQGGMAAVYKAMQVSMQREVALKVISPPYAVDKAFCERFLREARIAGAVNHPNVITCYDAGQDRGYLYMALELMTGGDAAQIAGRQGGKLEEQRGLRIIADCTRGLAALHRAGLIHRDIKPSNIFVSVDGHAKLADLGLARSSRNDERMTLTGASMGTPSYMSPEQANGFDDIDIRTDIYALGASLYALITGEPPYKGTTPWAVMAQVLKDPVPDPRAVVPTISGGTASIIIRALAKEREDRYADPLEFLDDLEAVSSGNAPVHCDLVPHPSKTWAQLVPPLIAPKPEAPRRFAERRRSEPKPLGAERAKSANATTRIGINLSPARRDLRRTTTAMGATVYAPQPRRPFPWALLAVGAAIAVVLSPIAFLPRDGGTAPRIAALATDHPALAPHADPPQQASVRLPLPGGQEPAPIDGAAAHLGATKTPTKVAAPTPADSARATGAIDAAFDHLAAPPGQRTTLAAPRPEEAGTKTDPSAETARPAAIETRPVQVEAQHPDASEPSAEPTGPEHHIPTSKRSLPDEIVDEMLPTPAPTAPRRETKPPALVPAPFDLAASAPAKPAVLPPAKPANPPNAPARLDAAATASPGALAAAESWRKSLAARDFACAITALPSGNLAVRQIDPRVRDLAALAAMPIETLDLSGCTRLTGDLSPLRGARLTKLDCTGCANLSGIAGVQGMPLSELILSGCSGITGDLTALRGAPLARLDLGGCESLRSLNGIQGMALTALDCHGCPIEDVTATIGMKLSRLDLTDCSSLRSLAGVQGMPLTELRLAGCSDLAGDLDALRGMKLTKLTVDGCSSLSSLDGIQDMPLTELTLRRCARVKNLAALRGLKLVVLDLSFCSSLTSLDGLQGMPLRRLIITRTSGLRDLTAVAGIAGLQIER